MISNFIVLVRSQGSIDHPKVIRPQRSPFAITDRVLNKESRYIQLQKLSPILRTDARGFKIPETTFPMLVSNPRGPKVPGITEEVPDV